jgi:uridine kinase
MYTARELRTQRPNCQVASSDHQGFVTTVNEARPGSTVSIRDATGELSSVQRPSKREDDWMVAPPDAIERVLAAIDRRRVQDPGPIRVAVDGRDAAGKTTFADRLALQLAARGAEIYRASIDDWQHPPDIRYRRGRFSPDGYYFDGFDFEDAKRRLLEPFSTGAGFTLRAYDIEREQAVEDDVTVAGPGSLLIVDGVFLFRVEVQGCFELGVYLRVSRQTSIDRGVARDAPRSGDAILERQLYEQRYAPAQDRYHEKVSPEEFADLVIDNEDVENPVVVRG